MNTGLLTPVAFLSALLLPWPMTALVAVFVGMSEPLVPFAVGLFIDVLYYSNGSGLPWATTLGAVASVATYFVRSTLRTRSM